MRTRAGEEVLKIISNDDRWNLFVRQVQQHGIDLAYHENPRERGRTDPTYGAFLQLLYLNYSAVQICDRCDYNLRQRRGQDKFAKRKKFDCTLDDSVGNGEERDRTQSPAWLNVKDNLCPCYYFDLTRG